MPRANAETCDHPRRKWRNKVTDAGVKLQGFYTCARCGSDVNVAPRAPFFKLSPRVTLEVGTVVSIRNRIPGCAREVGTFRYAEDGPSGVSLAVLTHEKGSNGRPIACGWRFVRPDMVTRA